MTLPASPSPREPDVLEDWEALRVKTYPTSNIGLFQIAQDIDGISARMVSEIIRLRAALASSPTPALSTLLAELNAAFFEPGDYAQRFTRGADALNAYHRAAQEQP